MRWAMSVTLICTRHWGQKRKTGTEVERLNARLDPEGNFMACRFGLDRQPDHG